MPNKKELELEQRTILLEMAGKIDFIFNLLSQATIASDAPVEEKKSERKNSKKAKKAE
jgi:hypothetical protein